MSMFALGFSIKATREIETIVRFLYPIFRNRRKFIRRLAMAYNFKHKLNSASITRRIDEQLASHEYVRIRSNINSFAINLESDQSYNQNNNRKNDTRF